ncbi:MAG TPA: MBL fold metallo-hydrolase [Chloroflexia bacterium]|jgi:glyoxylase-like metal-dependent hydrolase (beta-lactamase superfamily II)
MREIIPGIYTFTGLIVGRVYAIEDPDGLTLVDASVKVAAARIIDQLRKAGREPHDVKRILVTHAHPDHVGGLPELQRLTGAEIICSELERPVTEGKVAIGMISPYKEILESRRIKPPNTVLPGTPVDRAVNEGDVLHEVLGGLHVLLTPGHALGHITYWQPERRIAFCGDVIMHLIDAVGLTLPIGPLTPDMDENRRSIQRVASLEPEVLLFGHGKPLLENTARRVQEFSDRVNRP